MLISDIKSGLHVNDSIKEGLKKLCNVIEKTFGPRGKSVVIERIATTPTMSKDGALTAKEIRLSNRHEKLYADIVKDAANKVAKEVGDGTTTTMLLINILYNLIASDNSNYTIKQKILYEFFENFVNMLNEDKKVVKSNEDIFNIANISSNRNEMISLILKDIFSNGKDPLVHFEIDDSWETHYEFISGYHIERALPSALFINDSQNKTCVLKDPYVLLLDDKLNNYNELTDLLDIIISQRRDLVVITNDYTNEVFATGIINKQKNILSLIPIKSPNSGEYRTEILQDIATVTGAKVISAKNALDLIDINKEALKSKTIPLGIIGKCDKIIIDENKTIFFGNETQKNGILKRINLLKEDLNNKNLKNFEIEMIKERISKLDSGVAKIKIGGRTESEKQETYDKFEDAYYAVKSAVKDGYVNGACSSFLKFALTKQKTNYYSKAFIQLHEKLYEPLGLSNISNELIKLYNCYEKNDCDKFINFDDLKIKKIKDIIDPVNVIIQSTKTAIDTALLLNRIGAQIITNEIEDIMENK